MVQYFFSFLFVNPSQEKCSCIPSCELKFVLSASLCQACCLLPRLLCPFSAGLACVLARESSPSPTTTGRFDCSTCPGCGWHGCPAATDRYLQSCTSSSLSALPHASLKVLFGLSSLKLSTC